MDSTCFTSTSFRPCATTRLRHGDSTKQSFLPTQCSSGFARRCLAIPASRQRRKYPRSPVVKAAQIKPAYNKYRSRYDIEQDYIQQWKEVTARDSIAQKMTPWSFMWFVPVFVKYHVVPGILRYAWWLVWSAILAARYQVRKRLVLQGAKLDVQLIKSSKSSATVSFSRAMVLQRLHGRVSFVDNIKYRTQLLQGKHVQAEQQQAAMAVSCGGQLYGRQYIFHADVIVS